MIFRQIFFKMFRLAECIQISKYTVALDMTRIRYLNMGWICVHAHDFFLHICLGICKINTVSKRFTHLLFSISTRKTHTCFIIRKKHLRLHQYFIVNAVELADNLSCLLDHRELVFPCRNSRCLKCCNICSLTDWIVKKANRNTRLKIAHLNLRLYGRITL